MVPATNERLVDTLSALMQEPYWRAGIGRGFNFDTQYDEALNNYLFDLFNGEGAYMLVLAESGYR